MNNSKQDRELYRMGQVEPPPELAPDNLEEPDGDNEPRMYNK